MGHAKGGSTFKSEYRHVIFWQIRSIRPSQPAATRAASSHAVNQVEKPRDAPVANLPTGPRASQPSVPSVPEKPAATSIERPSSGSRLALERFVAKLSIFRVHSDLNWNFSVPKPEVVKRNRDTRPPELGTTEASKKEEPMQVDRQANGRDTTQTNNPPTTASTRPKDDAQHLHPSIAARSTGKVPPSSNDLRKEVLQGASMGSRPATPLPSTPANPTPNGIKDSVQSSPRLPSRDPGSPMPPPAEPSQAPHAQELRNLRRSDHIASGPREGAEAPSARRSTSPATRPGTRNASSDSRASGEGKRDRHRHEKSSDTGDGKRASHADQPSRAERSSGAHRDTHGRSERTGRDRIPGSSTRDTERERDPDRERLRDRERERDRPRDREREKSHRSERESHRDREHRDRSERERHRREDKDRERERERERERKPSGQNKEKEQIAPSSHALPARPDDQRHRTHTDPSQGDVSLGKRRRTPDDEVSI